VTFTASATEPNGHPEWLKYYIDATPAGPGANSINATSEFLCGLPARINR